LLVRDFDIFAVLTMDMVVPLLTSSDSITSFTVAAGVAAANWETNLSTQKPESDSGVTVHSLVLAGALSGCAAYHEYEKCGYDGCPGDAKITAEVKQALARHPDLEGTDTVYVETINHGLFDRHC
jgi:hypothetical protein